ncbi:hypothetical protein C8R46DRAFT_1026567 [Mycena filopes]|nr:hypothetical protein C8R46DRAFT_1026567 [Mycena filopes]
MHSPRCFLALVGLWALLFTSVNGSAVKMTNAERMRKGLPPLPPRNLLRRATPVRRDDPPTPSPTFWFVFHNSLMPASGPFTQLATRSSQIGAVNMALELRYASDDSLIGYIGASQNPSSAGLYNVVFAGYGGTSRQNGGSLFGVEYNSPYNAITIAGSEPGAWCAEVNQWLVNRTGYTVPAHSSQDLAHMDTYYNPEPQNFLFNRKFRSREMTVSSLMVRQCNVTAAAASTSVPTLEWLEDDTFPIPWYRPSTGLFRWYQADYAPTMSRNNGRDWVPAYVRWSCTVDPTPPPDPTPDPDPAPGGDAPAAPPDG